MDARIITLECPHCEAVTNAEVKGVTQEGPTDEAGGPWLVTLAACPKCGGALVGVQETYGCEDGRPVWTEPVRVWPELPLALDWRIPRDVRTSLVEARNCLKGKTYTASAAMTGRAMEAVCRHFKTQSNYLGPGLKELNKRRIISAQLNKWGRELHLYRNTAAHADPKRISKEEATDLFKFAVAICDYVFVHTNDYKAFMKRKKGKSS
jgi:hypothetical protein